MFVRCVLNISTILAMLLCYFLFFSEKAKARWNAFNEKVINENNNETNESEAWRKSVDDRVNEINAMLSRHKNL